LDGILMGPVHGTWAMDNFFLISVGEYGLIFY